MPIRNPERSTALVCQPEQQHIESGNASALTLQVPDYAISRSVIVISVVVERHLGACPISPTLRVGVLILAADFDRVVPLEPGEMLLPVVACIWPGHDRVTLNTTDHWISGGAEIPEDRKSTRLNSSHQ